METVEKIPVFVKIEKGKTICICHAGHKRCKENCEPIVVERDKFRGWKGTMRRDRFGR